AVRIRALPADQTPAGRRPKREGHALLVLEVSAEPKLQGFMVTGGPRIDKAVDDQGQKLEPAADAGAPPGAGGAPGAGPGGPGIPGAGPGGGGLPVPMMPLMPGAYGGNQRLLTVWVKLGEKQAKAIKELTGSITVQARAPSGPLVSVDNVLKAAGKTEKA